MVHCTICSSLQMLRAKPSTVFNSSTVPYASTRRSAFEMRIPPASPVCPPSPRFVAILIVVLLVVQFHPRVLMTLQDECELPCVALSSRNAIPDTHQGNL